jgi:biopolymer transport protein ExbD
VKKAAGLDMLKENFSRINIVPLVDIMLVLLVIVLITANFMVRGKIEVSLPQSEAASNETQEPLHLIMRADGGIFLDGLPLPLDRLDDALRGEDRNHAVLISADKELTLQPFISLMDVLKRLGFSRISVQTQK